MKGLFSAAVAAAMTTLAAGHAIWVEFDVNGVSQGKFNGLRLPTYDGPIENVNDAAVACNGGPNPLSKFSPNVIPVAAGSKITVRWAHTLDTDWKTGMIIDSSHKGPILAYLNKVSDALGPIPSSGWFKIHEEGYDTGAGKWAVDKLLADRGYSFTIPSCVAPGEYLLRVELIALHAAGNYPGAQLYMECAQIKITGGGSLSPPTVSFPGAYSGSDPGIKFNLYQPNINYIVPGPRPVTCGGSNPNPNPQTTTTTLRTTTRSTTTPVGQTTTRSTTTTTRSTTAATTTTSAGNGSGANLWAQCGGSNYSGPTTCAQGKCVSLNPYYSQCQP